MTTRSGHDKACRLGGVVAVPNNALEPTAYSVHSAPASGGGSPRAFGRVTRELVLRAICFLPLFLSMTSELDSNLTVIPIVVLSSYGSGR